MSSLKLFNGALVALAIFAGSCQIAIADTTTLICDIIPNRSACCIMDGAATIELNEAGGSVTVHYPSWHSANSGDRYPAAPSVSYVAKFDPNTITFVNGDTGFTQTINRLTGIFVSDSATSWTCHAAKAQF